MAERPPAALVGRDTSLGVLRSAIERAADGSPSVLLVTGETGVGKTRLLREVIGLEDPTVLYGSCIPVAGDSLPFAPLTQALRRLGANGVLRGQLDRSPDLARLMPGLAKAPTTGPPPGESSQLALFQSVLSLVDRLGAIEPVLHIVEDVHWADRSTLDLVRFLATNLTTERAVLVVTYRDDSVLPGTPLAAWLAELGRLAITERVPLERLGPQDTALLVAGLSEGDVDPQVMESMVARSAGNPLFVEHLLLECGGAPTIAGGLPTTLHELVLSRVAGLPEDTRRLLRASSVLGRPASIPLLAATIGDSVQVVESLLRPALDQHVLEVRANEAVGFRHPAFGEVVYAELLPSERARLHRSAAEALEAQAATDRPGAGHAADTRAGELARHWVGAGDRSRALDAAVAAGEAAERMYAFADAQANYARGAELMDQVPSSHDRVWLLTQAAAAANLVGDHDEAVRLASDALERTEDPAGRASLSAVIASFHYMAGRGAEAQSWFQQAKQLIPEDEVSVVAARVEAGLALFAASWSRLDEADAYCVKGLRVSRAVGARREEGMVRNAMGLVASARGDAPTAEAHLREALAIAREVSSPSDLATAYVNLSHVLGAAGKLDELVEVCREGSETLTRIGLARQIGSLLRANAGAGLIDAGRYAEAEDTLQEALTHHPRGIMAAPVLLQVGRLALVRGDLQVAWERCEQARIILESENAPDGWLRPVTESAAEVELWAGRPGAAYDLALDGLHLVEGSDEEAFADELVGLALRALADQADAQRDAASRRRLRGLLAPVEAARAGMLRHGQVGVAASAWHAAEAGRLGLANDPALWVTARTLWAEQGRPFAAAYARWREAEALLDRGAGSESIAAVRAAHGAAVALGAPRLAAEVERLAGWHRIDLLAAVEEADESALDAYALTAREVEVLTGLAAGRTNQEIADDLFISVKTASVHVSNILRKLGVSGRHEAARVAHRLGVGV